MNGSLASAAAAAAGSLGLAQESESSHRAAGESSPRPVLPHAHPHQHPAVQQQQHPHPHQPRPRSILRHPSPSISRSSSSSTSGSALTHRQKTLSFNPRIAGRRIDCLSDLGPAMVRTLWYTDADQADLTREVVANIRHMRSLSQAGQGQQGRRQLSQLQQSRSGGARPDNDHDDNDDEEEEFCPRGLEHMLNSRTLEEQSRAKNAAIAAVLDEQRLQRLRAGDGRRAANGSGEGAHDAHAYGPVCPTTLAVVAAAASRRHLEVALMRAAEDAASVRRYLRGEVGRDVVQRALEIEGRASSASTSTCTGAPASPEATAAPPSSSFSSAASSVPNQHQHQHNNAAVAAAAAAATATAATSSYLNTKRRLSARSLAGPVTPHPSSSVLGGTLSLREQSRRSSFLQQFAANGAGAVGGLGMTGTTLPRTTAPAPTAAGTLAGMPTFQPGSGLSMTTTSQAGIGRGQPMMKRRRSDGFLSASATSLFAASAQPPLMVVPSPNEAASTQEEVLPSALSAAVAGGSSSKTTPTATPLGNHIGSTVTPTTTSFSDLHIGGGYLSS